MSSHPATRSLLRAADDYFLEYFSNEISDRSLANPRRNEKLTESAGISQCSSVEYDAGRSNSGRPHDCACAGHPDKHPWVIKLLGKMPAKKVAVALANKMARIAWAILVKGDTFSLLANRPLRASFTTACRSCCPNAYPIRSRRSRRARLARYSGTRAGCRSAEPQTGCEQTLRHP
jgi:hypothetical protein